MNNAENIREGELRNLKHTIQMDSWTELKQEEEDTKKTV